MARPEFVDLQGRRGFTGFLRLATPGGVALVLICIVGAVVRFHDIGEQPLWHDEGYSEWASRQAFWYLFMVLPTFETNPPLYYAFLKCWSLLFGNGEAALRSLSVLFSVATIPLVFAMGRMLNAGRAGTLCGLIAATMFVLSPTHVQYAQEARAYAMFVFGVAMAMTGALWLMSNPKLTCAAPEKLSRSIDGRRRSWMLGMLAAGLAIALWAHNTGGAAVIAVVFPLTYWWLTELNWCPNALRRLLGAGAVSLALSLPEIWLLVSNLTVLSGNFTWLKEPTLEEFRTVIVRLLGSTGRGGHFAFVLFVSLAIIGVAKIWRSGRRSIAILLVAVGVGPIVLELVITFLIKPVFLERTLIYVNLPLFVAAGYAISGFRTSTWQLGCGIAVIGLMSLGLISYVRDFEKEPWNVIVDHVSTHVGQGEAVFLVPGSNAWAFEYYALRSGATFRRVGIPSDWPEPVLSRPTPTAVPVREPVDSHDMSRVSRYATRSKRVAIVLRRQDLFDPDSLVKNEILKTHMLTDSRRLHGITVLTLSARPGPLVP